ncbi:MAG: YdeI/OmpD-associated family protein [Longimicrobiales bacterium]|nr:YdeI/OmpD-associated family protein [Longimicrobiales bacterium]
MPPLEPEDVTHFATPEDFRAWLAKHHEARDELWVGFWKKATGKPSITWPESVDQALCFGWIDGIRKKIDDEAYTIRFTPRREGSVWSRRNIERYGVMQEEGLVEEAGQAAWDRRVEEKSEIYSYEQEKASLKLPGEYLARLKASKAAWADWQGRPPGYKRRVTHWIMSAKKEETRQRRLQQLIDDSAKERKVKPLRRTGE